MPTKDFTLLAEVASHETLGTPLEVLLRSRTIETKSAYTDPDAYFAVHDLHWMCESEAVYDAIMLSEQPDGSVIVQGSRDLATLERLNMGSAVHELLRTKEFLGAEPHRLLGIWACRGCAAIYGTNSAPIPVPNACVVEGCDAHWAATAPMYTDRFEYREIEVKNRVLGIVGHPDALWMLDTGEIAVLEMKTCRDETFLNARPWAPAYQNAPDPAHVLQGNVYAYALGLHVVYILYKNINGLGETSYAQHRVYLDLDLIAGLKAKLDRIREGIRSGSAKGAKRACPNRDFWRGKGTRDKPDGTPGRPPCPHYEKCFDRDLAALLEE